MANNKKKNEYDPCDMEDPDNYSDDEYMDDDDYDDFDNQYSRKQQSFQHKGRSFEINKNVSYSGGSHRGPFSD